VGFGAPGFWSREAKTGNWCDLFDGQWLATLRFGFGGAAAGWGQLRANGRLTDSSNGEGRTKYELVRPSNCSAETVSEPGYSLDRLLVSERLRMAPRAEGSSWIPVRVGDFQNLLRGLSRLRVPLVLRLPDGDAQGVADR
jgi:hypothetical protein